jgi:hypothetical protein
MILEKSRIGLLTKTTNAKIGNARMLSCAAKRLRFGVLIAGNERA